MQRTFSLAAALAATFLPSVLAASAPQCDPSNKCPQDSPCCSQYGQCGVGAYCLGGCDPSSSFSLQSCMPAPVCKSEDYHLTSLDDVVPNTQYLGDGSDKNWVSSGQPVTYGGDSILLTMAPDTVGTLLMSTHYVWYGKMSATLTTSQGQGVVTAFIMMSDVKDEIDYEFVGVDLDNAQSNYYWQGVTDYDNGAKIAVSNTVQNEHTYTIDWQPDSITWSVDGKVGRTVSKNDTFNSTDNKYHYPQTPSRVQLSLWPAGLPSNGEGTISWAGGVINWDSPYMQNGYYYAVVKEVTVECYDPPSGAGSGSSYYYTNTDGLESDVKIGNKNTVLGSLLASGENPDYDPNSSGASQPSSTAETVPGLSGGGIVGFSGGGPSVSPSAGASSGDGTGNSFVQGGGSSSEATQVSSMGGAVVALLGFFIGALVL